MPSQEREKRPLSFNAEQEEATIDIGNSADIEVRRQTKIYPLSSTD